MDFLGKQKGFWPVVYDCFTVYTLFFLSFAFQNLFPQIDRKQAYLSINKPVYGRFGGIDFGTQTIKKKKKYTLSSIAYLKGRICLSSKLCRKLPDIAVKIPFLFQ